MFTLFYNKTLLIRLLLSGHELRTWLLLAVLLSTSSFSFDISFLPYILKGPSFPEPLVTPEDMDKLDFKCDVTKSLHYVYEAITLTRIKIDGQCPLIGFAGAPVSLWQL